MYLMMRAWSGKCCTKIQSNIPLSTLFVILVSRAGVTQSGHIGLSVFYRMADYGYCSLCSVLVSILAILVDSGCISGQTRLSELDCR